MKAQAIKVLVIALLLCSFSVTGSFSQDKPKPEQLIVSLPANLQDSAKNILSTADEKQRAQMTDNLARLSPVPAMDFLLALLESDSSAAVRRVIVNRLGNRAVPKIQQALERCAAADADVDVALLALNKLRAQRMVEVRQSLKQRIELARNAGDKAALQKLEQEQERWISLVNGTMLPAFMRVTPPQFALKTKGDTVRVVTLGDYGHGALENNKIAGEPQKAVATAMLKTHKQKAFDFGLTLGDNFYPTGMMSPDDPRWQTLWNDLYNPLGLKFYVTMGNHDWGAPDSPAAEILFSQRSKTWYLPAPYYTYTAGQAQFFALDTNDVSDAQLSWLRDALAKSSARWKIVYGHHPIYSAGQHADNKTLIDRLLPELKDRVDIYLAGHDHDLQHLKPEGGVHFFVNGGGGAGIRVINANERSLFAKSSYGFAMLEIDADKIVVKFISSDMQPLYQYSVTKAASQVATGK